MSLSRSIAGSNPGPGHSYVSQDKAIGGSSVAPVGGSYYWTGIVRAWQKVMYGQTHGRHMDKLIYLVRIHVGHSL